ncbi:hypothetical protein Tco_0364847 [Tanacetum coccineum]
MSSSSSHATVTYTSSPKKAPLSHVPALEYPEYLALSDDDILAEDQPLPADASPTACSPGYMVDSEPIEDDLKEVPEMDPVDYPSDEEEEEPSASTDPALPIPDSIPSSEETEPFKTDEFAATPPPPYTVVPLSQNGLRRAQKTIRPQPPLPASIKAHITEYTIAPTPPSPPPSPLSPLSSLLPRIPSPPLLLPSPTRRDMIPEADMPPRKRACFTTPSCRFKIKESSIAAVARQPVISLSRDKDRIVRSSTRIIRTRKTKELCYRLRAIHAELLALQTKVRTLHAKVRMLQRQRIDDGDRLTRHIQHEHDRFRVLERTRDVEHQDGPDDADSSWFFGLATQSACILVNS